jgi:hypothetical protein
MIYVAEAVADMQRLLVLDSAWTDAGRRSREFNDRDREALVDLGKGVDTEIAVVERHVDVLRGVIQAHSAWLNERVAAAVTDERFASQRDVIGRVLSVENDDYAARVTALLDSLAERLPLEREEIRGKVRSIREAGPVVTDMSDTTLCAIAGAGFVLSLGYGPAGWGAAYQYGDYLAHEC